MVEQLEQNLSRFAEIVRKETGVDLADIPGAGAAGGTGGALLLLGGSMTPGIDLVLDVLNFNEAIQDADYVFTGEGKIGSQTPDGKVIAGISRMSKKANVPVIAFAGSLSPGYEPLYEGGLLAVHSITQGPCTLEEALKNGEKNLKLTVENVVRLLTSF